MKKIQITAKNVQKAIEQGLKELNATQDEVDIKILDEGGFFKKAKVELILDKDVEEKQAEEEKAKTAKIEESEVKTKETKAKKVKAEKEEKIDEVKKEEKTEDIISFGTNFLLGLFEKMNVEAEVSAFETSESITFNASGEKVSYLIGKRGETLNSIQDVLANVMKNANFRNKKVYFDVENYKNRREMSLINLADRMAKKALKIEKPIKLERMSAYERKIIHTALQNCEGVTTHSEGEEPNRYLVVVPVKKEDKE